MSVIRLQNENGDKNIVYEFDDSSVPLGEGGMGRVFRGRRIDLAHNIKRDVAIKMMFADLPDHVIERARREASIRVVNDNLLEMIDFVEVKERNAYGQILSTHYHVVSEFLDGINLDELLEGRTTNHNGKPNDMAERLYAEYLNNRKKFVGFVFRNILSGIMALHYSGYIHRDVDPSNIMVTSEGKIKLIDFGIARPLNAIGNPDRHLTNTGQFIGKPNYAAPELIMGDISHQDNRTDIYALGIMLFQLMVGHLPFEGPLHEVSDKQLHSKLPLSEVNDHVIRKIIRKATEKKQEKRYQTAAEFLVDIDRWISSNMGSKPGRTNGGGEVKIIMKTSVIAASVAVIVATGYVMAKKLIPNYFSQQNPIAEDIVDTPPAPDIPIPPKMEPPKTIKDAETLMMDKSTALSGFELLNTLVDKGDYSATFLKSRLYFDPSKHKEDALFYDDDWSKMRENCGINWDNNKAHKLLMDAFEIKDSDYVSLYELGCDFKSGRDRGCERDGGYAKWCFEEANKALESVPDEEAEKYKKQIKNKMGSLKDKKAKRPGNAFTISSTPSSSAPKIDLSIKDVGDELLDGLSKDKKNKLDFQNY